MAELTAPSNGVSIDEVDRAALAGEGVANEALVAEDEAPAADAAPVADEAQAADAAQVADEVPVADGSAQVADEVEAETADST